MTRTGNAWTFSLIPLTSECDSLEFRARVQGVEQFAQCRSRHFCVSYVDVPQEVTPNIPTAKETTVPTTEAERTIKNGKAYGTAEGFAESIAESFEGLAKIARTQADESFKQSEKAGLVVKDQSIASIRAAEAIGLSVLSAMADITAPLTPDLPSVVPVSNLETLVKAGFDIMQQLLNTERTLVEAAATMVIRQG